MLVLPALNHILDILEDAVISLVRRLRRARSGALALIAGAEILVCTLEFVTFPLETRDLCLVSRECGEIDPVRIRRTDEPDAVAPDISGELGGYLLAQNAQDGSSNHAHLVRGQRVVLCLTVTFNIDARLLGRRAHRLGARSVAGGFGRVVVAQQIDPLRFDDLRGSGSISGRCGEDHGADQTAQQYFQHCIHSRVYCSKK